MSDYSTDCFGTCSQISTAAYFVVGFAFAIFGSFPVVWQTDYRFPRVCSGYSADEDAVAMSDAWARMLAGNGLQIVRRTGLFLAVVSGCVWPCGSMLLVIYNYNHQHHVSTCYTRSLL